MAKIRSGATTDELTVDATSKAARVTPYNPDGTLDTNYPHVIAGIYMGHSGSLTVLAAAHAATAGFMWLLNPLASGRKLAIRRIWLKTSAVTALVAVTAPRITVERMTFTGTPSGATITPAKHSSADVTPVGSIRTASTGITPAADQPLFSGIIPAIMTAVGASMPIDYKWEPVDPNGEVILLPGEGLVFRQADAGTASDTRKLVIDITWVEYVN